MNLSGKKILFIAPKFHSYHTHIIDYLQSQNGMVTFYPEDIYTPFYRIAKKLFYPIANAIKKNYLTQIIKSVPFNSYDIVFVIRGGILSPTAMESLRNKLPNGQFIMYQWDSNRQSNYEPLLKYFDDIQTFDPKDAKKYVIKYLPLFYTKQYEDVAKNKLSKKYDIVFYGAYHSDRLHIIKFIDKVCRENNLIFKHHVYITKIALLKLLCFRVIKIKDLSYLKTYSVTTDTILDVYKESFATLDIELNIQYGLTMRTFEALGAGLKLITTNKKIKDEPFYNQNNITILDRNNLQIDLDFFQNDFSPDTTFQKYRFENWLNSVFKKVRE